MSIRFHSLLILIFFFICSKLCVKGFTFYPSANCIQISNSAYGIIWNLEVYIASAGYTWMLHCCSWSTYCISHVCYKKFCHLIYIWHVVDTIAIDVSNNLTWSINFLAILFFAGCLSFKANLYPIRTIKWFTIDDLINRSYCRCVWNKM